MKVSHKLCTLLINYEAEGVLQFETVKPQCKSVYRNTLTSFIIKYNKTTSDAT